MRKGNALLVCLAAASLAAGCKHGLNRVMGDYGYTAISPPQTNWEVGSVAEIESRTPTAPTLRITPTATPVPKYADLYIHDSQAPDVAENHDDKLDLSIGVSLPQDIRASLAAKNVSKYSVVAKGNVIKRIYIDEYAKNVFPVIAAGYGSYWAGALAEDKLFYFHELWCASSLEYRFYTSGDAAVTATLSQIPVNANVGYSWGSDGSLVYTGPQIVCLGYKARPIRQEGGGVRPEGSGNATLALPSARTDLYK